MQAKYTYNAGDGTISVSNSQYSDGEFSGVEGYVTCEGTTEADCIVKLSWFPKQNYQVVDTDYTSYAIVYSCKNHLGFLKKESAWILTRDAEADQSVIDTAIASLEANLPDYDYQKYVIVTE